MDKTLVDSLFTQTQLNASIVSIVSQTFQSFLDQKLVLHLWCAWFKVFHFGGRKLHSFDFWTSKLEEDLGVFTNLVTTHSIVEKLKI